MVRKKPTIEKGKARYFQRMKYDGTQKRRRKLYFNKKRTMGRIKELNILCRDVDYYMMELLRLEIRTGLKRLVSAQLRNFNIRLHYWEDRYNKYNSDWEAFRKIGLEFDMPLDDVRKIVYAEEIETQFWLIEKERGRENRR